MDFVEFAWISQDFRGISVDGLGSGGFCVDLVEFSWIWWKCIVGGRAYNVLINLGIWLEK